MNKLCIRNPTPISKYFKINHMRIMWHQLTQHNFLPLNCWWHLTKILEEPNLHMENNQISKSYKARLLEQSVANSINVPEQQKKKIEAFIFCKCVYFNNQTILIIAALSKFSTKEKGLSTCRLHVSFLKWSCHGNNTWRKKQSYFDKYSEV